MERFFQNDTVLRVLALVLACIIWLTVGVQGSTAPGGSAPTTIAERFPFTVQVEVAPDMVVSGVSPERADVVVRVNSAGLTALPGQMTGVQVVANATGLAPGRHTVPLMVLNMPDVSYSVQPKQISVVLERKVTVQRTARVLVKGEAAPGYLVGSADVYPAIVRVSGSRSAVEQVVGVQVPVSIDGATRTVTQTVPVVAVTSDGKPATGVETDPASVTVTIPVRPPLARLPLVPQVVGDPAAGFAVAGVELHPDKASLYGGGAPPAGGIEVPVEVSGLRQRRALDVQVPLPAGAVKADPNRVRAVVDIEPSLLRTFTDVPLGVRGAPLGMEVQVVRPTRVNVVVSGPASVVNRMAPDDVAAYVEASSLQQGWAQAPVDVEVPAWVRVVQLSARSARVHVR